MTGTDLATYIAAGAAVISVLYSAAERHWPMREADDVDRTGPSPKKTSLLLHWLPAMTAIGAVGFNYYYIHEIEPTLVAPTMIINSWGTQEGGLFYAVINTSYLSGYAVKYNMVFIVSVAYADVDRMTDTYIAKSSIYTITGGLTNVAVANPVLRLPANPALEQVDFNLAVIPKVASLDDIKTLGDVSRIGGVLVAKVASVMVLTRSATNPPVAPPPAQAPE